MSRSSLLEGCLLHDANESNPLLSLLLIPARSITWIPAGRCVRARHGSCSAAHDPAGQLVRGMIFFLCSI